VLPSREMVSLILFARMETVDEILSNDGLVLGLRWVTCRMCCASMLIFENGQ